MTCRRRHSNMGDGDVRFVPRSAPRLVHSTYIELGYSK